MAWVLIAGISIVLGIITFICCWINDFPPYDYLEHLGAGLIVGIGTFSLVAMFSIIICSSCYDNEAFPNQKNYVNLTSQIYYLDEIQNEYFTLLNMDTDEVNFIYETENKVPVLCAAPEKQTKIYTNIKGESPMVSIKTWRISNWYACSILGKESYITTYEIYLPNEVRIIN